MFGGVAYGRFWRFSAVPTTTMHVGLLRDCGLVLQWRYRRKLCRAWRVMVTDRRPHIAEDCLGAITDVVMLDSDVLPCGITESALGLDLYFAALLRPLREDAPREWIVSTRVNKAGVDDDDDAALVEPAA